MIRRRSRLGFKIRRFLKRHFRGVLSSAFAVVLIFSIAIFAFPPVKNFFQRFFVVKRIEVKGVQYNSPEIVSKFLSVYKGKVNWKIKRTTLKKELKKRFKWIKSIAVSNILSSKLVVYIEEQSPFVFYRDQKGELWIVGENGEILCKFKSRNFGYVYLPVLTCKKGDIPFIVDKIKVMPEVDGGEYFFADISEIIVRDKDRKWLVFLNDFKPAVYLDPLGNFNNLMVFLKIKKRLSENIKGIEYVDLSFKDQIIVKKTDGGDKWGER